jgi:hypothetical protein
VNVTGKHALKKKTRLTVERTEKLVMVNSNLKFLSSSDLERAKQNLEEMTQGTEEINNNEKHDFEKMKVEIAKMT